MIKLVVIGFGGAIGAISRYLLSGWVHSFMGASFPWGTFVVNMVGSFVIGFCGGIVEEVTLSQNMKLFIFMGLLGSFTTFSTFSYENFQMVRDGEYGFIAANVGASIFVGFVMVFAGIILARMLMTTFR